MSVPNVNVLAAESLEKMANAQIAQAAALMAIAALYRGGLDAQPPAQSAATTPAPTTAASKKAPKKDAAPAATPAPTVVEVQTFATDWIKTGASDAAQLAIKSQIVSIVNKYGAQKIAELPPTTLGPVLAELTAAKAGGAAAPSVIDI